MISPRIAAECSADCATCPIEASAHLAAGPYRGGRLALVAAAFFLGPLVLALGGAAVAGPGQIAQFAGGVAGLGGGLVLAALAARGARPVMEVAS